MDVVAGAGAAPNDRRATLALASHSVAFQHHCAITILVDNGLHGSAAALLRSMYEGCVNGLWLTYAADEHHLKKFEEDRYRPEPSKALRQLRSHDDGEYIETLERLHNQVMQPLNSYAHTGALQVVRHIGSDFIGPNFTEVEIEEFLELADAVLIASGLELPRLLGLQSEEGVQEAVLRYKSGRSGPHTSNPNS
ncbi:DUF6988 family protein [Roseateles sp.]|uniref:DUF6988 family protein n=1 Tax=Roseateles sp. TaxID=1971397 RepID=UPI0032672A66